MPFKTLIVANFDKEEFDWTTKIDDSDIAFIIDDIEKIVYVWNGQKVSMLKKYKGGTLATKVKSSYQFYGFKTIIVNQGEETGPLRAEVDALLAGSGAALSDDELENLKPIASGSFTVEAIDAVPRIDYKVKSQELEEAFEAEKKNSEKLKDEMDAFPEINWQGIARAAIQQKLNDIKFMRHFTADSDMTGHDAERLGRELNERLAKRHGLIQ